MLRSSSAGPREARVRSRARMQLHAIGARVVRGAGLRVILEAFASIFFAFVASPGGPRSIAAVKRSFHFLLTRLFPAVAVLSLAACTRKEAPRLAPALQQTTQAVVAAPKPQALLVVGTVSP